MKFMILLVLFANPSDVTNASLTLQPAASIEFQNTTEKNTLASCERVRKALVASGKVAMCGNVEMITAIDVASVTE